ncbi:MAG: bifunctional nuclease family protein [Actinobacteria bacterium]|nr:bifunctional nuclease family protein [Actinomycetota bacterium]
MREVDVLGVRLQLPNNAPVVLLKERDGQRVLPIWIGAPEAAAIAFGLEGTRPERPLTHDLLLDVATASGRSVTAVEVTQMIDQVFYADLILDDGTRVTARPSDAIAVAVRGPLPISVADDVMDEAAVVPDDDEESAPTEDDLEQFRAFLDTVSPEDFDSPQA